MRDKSPAPIISPDGRFEAIIEDLYDRGIHDPYTVLVERSTGKQLFTCKGEPRAEFASDGMLTIHYPGYEPGGVQIDPARCAFRTHPSEPWVPAAAWGIVESAYRRGWAQGIKFQQENRMSPTPTPFPWVAIILLLGSVVALPALGAQTRIYCTYDHSHHITTRLPARLNGSGGGQDRTPASRPDTNRRAGD